jgi:hypothetical protein
LIPKSCSRVTEPLCLDKIFSNINFSFILINKLRALEKS